MVLMLFGILVVLRIKFISGLINALTIAVLKLVDVTNVPVVGFIDKIDFSFTDMIFLSLLIVTAAAIFHYKKFSQVLFFLILCASWLILSINEIYNKKIKSDLIVYQCNKETAIDIKNKTYLYSTSNVKQRSYDFHIKNHQAYLNYPDYFPLQVNYIATSDKKILIVKRETDLNLCQYLLPDYLIITNNIIPDLNHLKPLKLKQLVCDGSNTYKSTKTIKKMCQDLRISFYPTKEYGYLELPL